MALVVLRCVFLMVAIALGFQLASSKMVVSDYRWVPWVSFLGVLGTAMAVLTADFSMKRKRLDTITAVYFGLIIGVVLSYVLFLAFSPYLDQVEKFNPQFAVWLRVALASILCYTCISVLLQTKDDFRFIIPYVEFAKEVKGLKPLVLDTSVVIDGRIADVVETRIVDNQLVMPQFVIAELQNIADSNDKLRRNRGRRGLDILNKLRSDPKVDLMIYDRELPQFAGQTVDQKLVLLAKHLEGKVVTNDYNLNKVAKLHNVGVINLNDIANSLKPVFLPGEHVEVRIVKPGEEPGQGVGYLEDGTMVVIEGGREHVGHSVAAAVTSVLQTSAGRMIFGRCERRISDQSESTPASGASAPGRCELKFGCLGSREDLSAACGSAARPSRLAGANRFGRFMHARRTSRRAITPTSLPLRITGTRRTRCTMHRSATRLTGSLISTVISSRVMCWPTVWFLIL